MAGVGAMEEFGAEGCSGIVDADPCASITRFGFAGVADGVAPCEKVEA